MPAKSAKQRAYIYAKFGKAWAEAHHFNTKGKLPTRTKKARKK